MPEERRDEINEKLTLTQKKTGLTFGTDAFLLSAFVRRDPGGFAVDLGCGTGVVSLLLAARGAFRKIAGVEIQEDFAALTRKNAAENGFSDTVSELCLDVRDLTPARIGGEADAVFSNPPYLRADCGYASPYGEKQIARHEVFGGIGDFAAAAARCLRYGGTFTVVWRPERLAALLEAFRENGLAPKRMVFVEDYPGKEPSLLLAEAKKGGAEGISFLPTLCLHDEKNAKTLSARAQKIYDTGVFL